MISAKDFDIFCQIARSHSVKRLVLEGIEIEFTEKFDVPTVQGPVSAAAGMPTDDQLLMWSTDFMQDRKES